MKIYHTATQEDYDALMTELEGKGRKWIGGNEPTFFKFWKTFKESTCIRISDKGVTFGNIEQYKKQYPDTLIIEYKAKGDNMEIYHTETQEDYDELMIELEEKGITWSGGSKPTSINNWQRTGSNTCISLNNRVIEYCDTSYYNHNYPFIEIIEYKAKGDKQMLNPECKHKHCHKKWHQDSAKYCSWCGKKLVSEHEFKVGDYVTDTSDDDPFICKIEEFEGNDILGIWYCVSKKYFYKLLELPISTSRLSTPEEIAEYESALTFHEHGRKPFEVKKGDLVKLPSGSKEVVAYPETLFKSDFTKNGRKLLATAEEVNEWLENKLTQDCKTQILE